MNSRTQSFIFIGIAVVIIISVLAFSGIFSGGGTTIPPISGTLEFWGFNGDENLWRDTITAFTEEHKGISVSYRELSEATFEERLVNALARGTGPDIFLIHNTWLPKHGDKLKPLPATIPGLKQPLLTIQDYKTNFVDVAFNDFVFNNQIYALPLYVDTLALFYNKDVLNSAGITRPPQDWEEFNSDVETITRLDGNGQIVQSAAAIGTARNINRSTDLLSALMIQTGVRMTDADNTAASFASWVNNTPVGESALKYYTDFANPSVRTYTWNDVQHYSVDAFTEGKTAMMFNYSHQVGVLKNK